ncbi:MAG: Bax inhibitor-1/YccA family protein [Muribaculaceae bacterium]|nr:Bax inhibitor-1/YccA family protein [Muribaculaceae bacterium]
MNDFNRFDNYNGQSTALATVVSNTMKRVYVKMTLALIVTALTAWFAATSAAYMNFLFTHSWFMWVLIIAELGIVFGVSGAITRMSSATASMLFYLFAVVNGLMLCTIFYAYAPMAIVKTFFITAGTFGAMSVYGYFTHQNLAKIGSILSMCLIGLLIAIVVNIFLRSSSLDWIISIVGVLLFIGLTAWDTQQIKTMAQMTSGEDTGRLATLGALNLYLDFINLFLFLLRIFGGNRD